MPVSLTITSGRHSLQTVTHGVKPSTRPCPLSKKTAWTASRRNGTVGRHVWLRFQSKTRPSPATTATGHASPALALSATSVPAGDMDNPLLNLRLRSHATTTTFALSFTILVHFMKNFELSLSLVLIPVLELALLKLNNGTITLLPLIFFL